MRPALLYLLLYCCVLALPAQNRAIDSLKKVLGTQTEDSTRVRTLVDLGWEYFSTGDYKQALALAKEGSALAERINFPAGKAGCENLFGVISANTGALPEAIQHFTRYAGILREKGDSLGAYVAYNNIGRIYKMQGNYVKALKNYLASLQIMERHDKRKEIAGAYNNVGSVYLALRNYEDALRYYRKATEVALQTNNTKVYLSSRKNAGSVYFEMGRNREALDIFLKMLPEEKAVGDKEGIANTYSNLGVAYMGLADFRQAELNFDSALALYEEMNYTEGVMNTHQNRGRLYLTMGRLDASEKELVKAERMATEQADKDMLSRITETLSELYTKKNDHALAFAYFKKHVLYADSLVNEENTKKVVQEEMNFEFEKKQADQKAEQDKKDAIAVAEKRRQQIILWSISAFGLLVLGFAVFAYRSFLRKKKANEKISRQKSLIEEKQKEILDSIHYAKRIQLSLLPSERHVKRLLQKYR